VERVVEDALRVAQFRHPGGVALRLERVGLRVDQTQRLDGAQVARGLHTRSGESTGAVLGDERGPHGECSERDDRDAHAGDGDPGEELRVRGDARLWLHARVSAAEPKAGARRAR
jgi:hypothetical protein